jgi:hypothetical protein
MFKNKHVVVAMLVAPVLSILAWFAVDYFVGERPQAAKPGAAYLLVAKSNCRYDSGQCDLTNADFELTLRPTEVTTTSATFELVSKFPLQQATIGVVDGSRESPPSTMVASGPAATAWTTTTARPDSAESTLRIAVIAQEATYYAEVPAVFLRIE